MYLFIRADHEGSTMGRTVGSVIRQRDLVWYEDFDGTLAGYIGRSALGPRGPSPGMRGVRHK